MHKCKAVISEKKVCNKVMDDVKKLLETDSKYPLIAFTFDEFGNIKHFTSEKEFDKSPFDLKDQKFNSIVPVSLIVSEGTHSVTINIAGESTTSSMPF